MAGWLGKGGRWQGGWERRAGEKRGASAGQQYHTFDRDKQDCSANSMVRVLANTDHGSESRHQPTVRKERSFLSLNPGRGCSPAPHTFDPREFPSLVVTYLDGSTRWIWVRKQDQPAVTRSPIRSSLLPPKFRPQPQTSHISPPTPLSSHTPYPPDPDCTIARANTCRPRSNSLEQAHMDDLTFNTMEPSAKRPAKDPLVTVYWQAKDR